MHVDEIVEKIKIGYQIYVKGGPYQGERTVTGYWSFGPRVSGVWVETLNGERLVFADEIEDF